MLLFLALSLGSALVAAAIALLVLQVRAARRRPRGDFPLVMARSSSLGRVEMPTPPEERARQLEAEAEAEARRILESAEQAAKVLLEAAAAAKASAEAELAQVRATIEEELSATRGRMDALRRQCLEELAQLEVRRAALAAGVREAEARVEEQSIR